MPDEDVFDLDDYIAENTKEPYRFKRGGQQFHLPHFSDIDWRVAEGAESGDVSALRRIFRLGLGDDQWAEFEKHPQPAGAIGELFRRWQKHAGLKPGESQGSSDSSQNTAEPSTRPSAATAARRSATRSPRKAR